MAWSPDMFPQTIKKGLRHPAQKLPGRREPLDFKGFSAISYLICVSSTTVSIPHETMKLIHISLARSRKWAKEHIYLLSVRGEHVN